MTSDGQKHLCFYKAIRLLIFRPQSEDIFELIMILPVHRLSSSLCFRGLEHVLLRWHDLWTVGKTFLACDSC